MHPSAHKTNAKTSHFHGSWFKSWVFPLLQQSGCSSCTLIPVFMWFFNHNTFNNNALGQGGRVGRTKWFSLDFQLLSASNCKSKPFTWPLITTVATVCIWLWEQQFYWRQHLQMALSGAVFTRHEPGGDKAEVWKHVMCSGSGGKNENQGVLEALEVN